MLQRLGNVALLVEHVGDAAAHARGEVAAGRAEHDHAATGHVLAAVIADALDDGPGAGVAHREALAGEAPEERPPGSRAVEHGVAHDHVLLGLEVLAHALARADREDAAGEALAGVVVGVAAQRERDSRRQPAAEALAGRALEVDDDRVLGQAPRAVALGDVAGEDAADAAVAVADRQGQAAPARAVRAPAAALSTSCQSSASSSTAGGGFDTPARRVLAAARCG